MPLKTLLIALGGNLPTEAGEPQVTLHRALDVLQARTEAVEAVSRFFATPCFPKGAGPDYVNAAAVLKTDMSAHRVLDILHEIEAMFGRAREERWGRRTLDLDLLAVGDDVLPDLATYQTWRDLALDEQMQRTPDTLILPHPRLHERAFVLIPLADVAPEWQHPVLRRSVVEMLADLHPDDVAEVMPL